MPKPNTAEIQSYRYESGGPLFGTQCSFTWCCLIKNRTKRSVSGTSFEDERLHLGHIVPYLSIGLWVIATYLAYFFYLLSIYYAEAAQHYKKYEQKNTNIKHTEHTNAKLAAVHLKITRVHTLLYSADFWIHEMLPHLFLYHTTTLRLITNGIFWRSFQYTPSKWRLRVLHCCRNYGFSS